MIALGIALGLNFAPPGAGGPPGSSSPVNTEPPALSTTTAQVDVEMSCSDGVWDNADAFYYQWEYQDIFESWYAIEGAMLNTFTPDSSFLDNPIRCTVTAENVHGTASASSNQSDPTIAGPVPVNSVVPALSTSAPQAGVEISSDSGTWSNSPTDFLFQWEYFDGLEWALIDGATDAFYPPDESVVDKSIRCTVTAGNAYGFGEPASSDGTDPVLAAPANPPIILAPPSIWAPEGEEGYGKRLEVNGNGFWEADPEITAYYYQWFENGSPIEGAAGSSYYGDAPNAYICSVTAENAHGLSEPALSNEIILQEPP